MFGEVKDVQQLGWTRQLRAQFAVANQKGYSYVLFIRSDTTLPGDLAEAVYQERTIDVQIH